MVLYRAKGCEKCQFAGYHGRRGIFELLVMTEELKQFTNAGPNGNNSEGIIRSAVMKSLRDGGLDLVKEGITTVEEVFRTTVE